MRVQKIGQIIQINVFDRYIESTKPLFREFGEAFAVFTIMTSSTPILNIDARTTKRDLHKYKNFYKFMRLREFLTKILHIITTA